VGVATAPFPTFGDNHLLARLGQVFEHKAGRLINDDRAGRNLDREIGSGTAMTVRRRSRLTMGGTPTLPVRYRSQRVNTRLGDENHAAAVSTVTTIGATTWNVLLAAETHSSAPAVPSNNLDLRAIDKHDRSRP
jgi:hypothetical protein